MVKQDRYCTENLSGVERNNLNVYHGALVLSGLHVYGRIVCFRVKWVPETVTLRMNVLIVPQQKVFELERILHLHKFCSQFLVNGYPLCCYALKYNLGKSLSWHLEEVTMGFNVFKIRVLSVLRWTGEWDTSSIKTVLSITLKLWFVTFFSLTERKIKEFEGWVRMFPSFQNKWYFGSRIKPFFSGA